MTRIRRPWLMVALGAALLAGPLAADGHAKRTRSFVKALVNGKRLKASKRGIQGFLAGASFSIAGATKPKHRIVRTVTVNCGAELTTVTPGTKLTDCFGSYTEAGGKAGTFRQWTGNTVELTVDSFDGDRVVGSFRGVLLDPSSANPSDAAATVEGGTFSVSLFNLGV
jgi:hypothetical protein